MQPSQESGKITILRQGKKRVRWGLFWLRTPFARVGERGASREVSLAPRIERQVKGLSSYRALEVEVHDNDVEKALRQLKKKINDEGLFKTLKLKRSYEKPSEYRRRKERESRRRRNRMMARRRQRER